MNKKLIIAALTASLVLSGCSNTSNNAQISDSNSSESDVSQTSNESDLSSSEISYVRPADSSKFSRNDVIYFIMTDRFNDGDSNNNNFTDVNKSDPKAYHGGDFKGITDKLDYIKSIGSTAIWITPVVENTPYGYHGYWADNFESIDPHLGTMDDLKTLVDKAHEKDIKVIVDYVVNHTGYDSSLLSDPSKKDWFHDSTDIVNWGDQSDVENGRLAGLPDMNTENDEYKEYILNEALKLIDMTGIDGMRLDTVRHVPKEFWTYFVTGIKSKYPDFYFIGEVWSESVPYMDSYYQTGIDSITDYNLYKGIREGFKRFGNLSSLAAAIKQDAKFTSPYTQSSFIDNHDNTRFMTEAGEYSDKHIRQALTFLLTYPSIPVVYYGTEIGMEGGQDPDNRRDMEFDQVVDNELLEYYKFLINTRNLYPEITNGKLNLLSYDKYHIVYSLSDETHTLLIAMNTSTNEKKISFENIFENRTYFRDLSDNRQYNVIENTFELTLQPFDIILLRSE